MAKSLLEQKRETYKLADHYGIDLSNYHDDDGNPRSGIGGAEMNQLRKDIATAASNDYDLRETLTAASNSGKKKAQDILDKKWNYKDLSGINNALNFQRKAAARHGQGGTFSTASDAMGLTQSMQEREKRIEAENSSNGDNNNSLKNFGSEIAPFKDLEKWEIKPEIAEARIRAAQVREDALSGRSAARLYDMDMTPTGDNSFLARYLEKMPNPLPNGNYLRDTIMQKVATGFTDTSYR